MNNMEIILDAAFLGEREQAHDYLKEMLDLPDYYGRNLDALHDCLSEMNGLEIVIKNASSAGDYLDRLLPVFEDATGKVTVWDNEYTTDNEQQPGETEFDRLSEPSNCSVEPEETDERLTNTESLGDYEDFSDGDN